MPLIIGNAGGMLGESLNAPNLGLAGGIAMALVAVGSYLLMLPSRVRERGADVFSDKVVPEIAFSTWKKGDSVQEGDGKSSAGDDFSFPVEKPGAGRAVLGALAHFLPLFWVEDAGRFANKIMAHTPTTHPYLSIREEQSEARSKAIMESPRNVLTLLEERRKAQAARENGETPRR